MVKRKRLTKKQIKTNKKDRYMQSKSYANKQAKKQLKQKDKEWSIKVRELHPECLICGSTAFLNSHHILPREISETRHIILNGVILCSKCHKWGLFSAHRNPVWFLLKLRLFQPESYNFAMSAIPLLNDGVNNR